VRRATSQGIAMKQGTAAQILLFELNEVPYRVVDDYVARHPGSALARVLPKCAQWRTVTEDRLLSPWVTWPSVHRGVFDSTHTIQHFGQSLQDIDARYPPLWKILRGHGERVGVFASLHSYPLPPDAAGYEFYVPDPFASGAECVPARLASFQELNLTMSRQSARNVSTHIPWRAAARFAARAPGLGLRASTVWATLDQLRTERSRPWARVRRRTFQTVLAFDLFTRLLQQRKPRFCTFFTNHVASAMHRYWAATYPGDYDAMQFDATWRATFQDEIDYAMGWFDRFLQQLVRTVDSTPGAELWVASSMGQAAVAAQPVETQLYITDLGRFMTALGFEAADWTQRPAMAPEVSLFVREDKAPALHSALETLRVGDRGLHFSQREGGFFMISAGQENLPAAVAHARLGDRHIPLAEAGLENVAIEDQSTSSAYHVPEGMLWVYAGAPPRPARPPARTIDIAPAILTRLGYDPPATMAGSAAAILD